MLERLAQAELDALLRDIGSRYRTGAADELAARDPAWAADLEAREAEVGRLYAALCEADTLFERWQEALTALRRAWERAAVLTGAEEEALRDHEPRLGTPPLKVSSPAGLTEPGLGGDGTAQPAGAVRRPARDAA